MFRVTCIIILSVLFLTFGCSDQYTVEKQYWKVKQQRDLIINNPEASPPNQLERAVQTLTNFIKKYPQNRLAIDAEFDIATLYVVKNEYEKAREQLSKMMGKYNKSEALCSEAMFLIGNSYQIEGKWDSALLQYKKVIDDYPRTIRGMDMPIYIAEYYKVKYQPEKMFGAYQEAIEYYTQLANKYPNSHLAYLANKLTGRCYMEIKEWQNALDTFNKMLEAYKDNVDLDDILMNIAIINAHELKDKEKASVALTQLITNYPKSKFIKAAKFTLEELNRK